MKRFPSPIRFAALLTALVFITRVAWCDDDTPEPEAPAWLTFTPTNDTPPDLSAPDAPVTLSADSSSATPPLADALAAWPDATPDDPAPDPDPDAPPPDSQDPVIQPDCTPADSTTNVQSQGHQALAQQYYAGLPLVLSAPSNDRIAETARALDYNWAQCYLFVRNQIKFTPCKGIQRGPLRTLLDREGNDADQSLLLQALLQASGYTNATVFYVPATNGGFRVKLGGTTSGYDACGWLGVAQDNVAHAYTTASQMLQAGMVATEGQQNGTFDTSILSVDHFWVRLTLNGQTYDLDPSFKPRCITAPRNVLSDMGYSRTNLLAQAGGITNADYVQGINTTNLAAELRRLSANLAATWRTAATNAPTGAFVGDDKIVPQDLASDTNTFHGSVAGTAIDFLAQADAFKNSFRYGVNMVHLCNGQDNGYAARKVFWLDEVADRALWFQYNSSGYASLVLESTTIASEGNSGYSFTLPFSDGITITMSHPFGGSITQTYPITRGLNYINSVAVGFCGDHAAGMRKVAQEKLESIPIASGTHLQLARLQQVVGQQWLAQTALSVAFANHLDGKGRHAFYNLGITAQTASPYVDLRNIYAYSTQIPNRLDGYMLFGSALEHGVLDQVNGTNRPAVSTVRIIALANSSNQPIYFATAANWTTVSAGLKNYKSSVISTLAGNVAGGHKALLPKDGGIALNQWKGFGYIDYYATGGSLQSSTFAIGGGLGGGFNSCYWNTQPSDAWSQYGAVKLADSYVASVYAQDPVDMLSGAHVADRTDLAISGPMPLAFTRHYDSRLRYSDLSVGRGWSHNYDVSVNVHADPDALLGRTTPEACAASAVAVAVANDLMSADENAKNLTTACLVAKWWTDQLVEGAATVTADGQALSFTRRPDGSYAPAPGVTAVLIGTNHGPFILQERLGRTWSFDTNQTLAVVTDPSGNFTKLYYNTYTNLVAVSNSFGSKLTLSWSNDHQHISSVLDSAGRSVSYTYDSSYRLNQVTDPASYIWKCSYNADYGLASETDPENVTTVQNAYNALGQVTNQIAANGQHYVFAFADGVRSWDRSPLGCRTLYSYTDEGRLSQRIDLDGSTNAIFYDGQGHAVTNINALGYATVSAYDVDNNLLSVVEAANSANARTTAFGYDSQFHLVAVTNPLGRVTRMTYDTCHRLASRTTPDGTTVTNVYESRGLPTSTVVSDAAGHQLAASTFAYSSAGHATNVTSTDAGSVFFRHDKAGNVTNIVDALGRTSRFSYDARSLLTGTVDPAGHTTSRTYTPAGRLATATDPLTRSNTCTWTRSGNPAATIGANGGIATNYYDTADRLVAAKDPRGTRVDLALDAMGRTTNRYSATWSESAWFDSAGCATTTVDAVGGRTDVGYDGLSRPVAVVDPLNRLWLTGCDPLNGVTNSVDARGRVTRYGLDNMGRRIGVTYPSGRTEGFGFDALGRQTSFTNSEGHVYQMAYDGQGRLIAATNAASEQVFRNFFDPCGNLTNHVDGAGRFTCNRFDALNHCTNTLYADGSSEAFTFDAVGNLLTARNAGTTNTFGYDSMNRLIACTSCVAGVSFATAYRYDLGGLVTNVVYPGGNTVRYFFDADGRVTNVVDWAGHAWQITRDAAGRMTALAYPNGVSGAWQYDASHAVTSWSYSGADTNLPGRSITRDAMGLKTRDDITGGPLPLPPTNRRAVNTFDAADRLTSALVGTGTNPVVETYLYDGCGALTNVASGEGGSAYSYDSAGRMLSADCYVRSPHYTSADFSATYDALGNRVETLTVLGSSLRTSLWVIDHNDPLKRPLLETDANGVPVRYYIWGAGMLLGIIDASSGEISCAHSDEQGSIVALTDSKGEVSYTAAYGPYGEPWGTSGYNPIPFGWLGGHGVFHVDGTSLYLTKNRAYDSTLKRFLSADSMGLGGGGNLYGYANGNPLAYIDPLGLCGESVAQGAWNGFTDYMANDYSANMNKACGTILNSAYNAIAGTAGYVGRLTDDWSGTLAGTFNNPANAIQNYNPSAEFDSWSRDPAAIAASVWGGGLAALGLSPAAAAGDAMAVGAAETTAISPFRYTQAGETFQHYSYAEHAESLAGGLRPASYGTTAEGLSGVEAQEGLALRHATPPDAVYTVSPPAGTPVRVNPITQPQFGQPGGLPEIEFILGTPPGSVSGPTLISRGVR